MALTLGRGSSFGSLKATPKKMHTGGMNAAYGRNPRSRTESFNDTPVGIYSSINAYILSFSLQLWCRLRFFGVLSFLTRLLSITKPQRSPKRYPTIFVLDRSPLEFSRIVPRTGRNGVNGVQSEKKTPKVLGAEATPAMSSRNLRTLELCRIIIVLRLCCDTRRYCRQPYLN